MNTFYLCGALFLMVCLFELIARFFKKRKGVKMNSVEEKMLANTANVVDRVLDPEAKKRPVLFIDDGSGEPWQLIGNLDERPESKALAKENVATHVVEYLKMLREGGHGDEYTMKLQRRDMTQAEIDALPDL